MEKLRSHWKDFLEIWFLSIFWKSTDKFKFYKNRTRIKGTLREGQCAFLSYLYISSTENEECLKKIVGKIKTIQCPVTFFFRKFCPLWDNVEKYCRAGQATDDNMVRARCVVGIKHYRHTSRICDTYCLSTVTVGCANTPQCYVIPTLTVFVSNCEEMRRQDHYMVHRFPIKIVELYTTEQSSGEDHNS
jgi:hypothetical protein